jgi:hypothetical protein
MATMLEEFTTKKQSSVASFLSAKELNAKDIHKEFFFCLRWEVFVA